MDENEAKDVLNVAATEPMPEQILAADDNPPVIAPRYTGVVGHIRNVIESTANDLGADFNHVRDMIFKHL